MCVIKPPVFDSKEMNPDYNKEQRHVYLCVCVCVRVYIFVCEYVCMYVCLDRSTVYSMIHLSFNEPLTTVFGHCICFKTAAAWPPHHSRYHICTPIRRITASFPGSTAQRFFCALEKHGAARVLPKCKKKCWAVEPGNEARELHTQSIVQSEAREHGTTK